MKKGLIILALVLMALAGCAPATPAPVVYNIGTASVTSIGRRDITAEAPGRIRVDVTTATVVLDQDGKFVTVILDTAQNEGTFGADGVVIASEAQPTKRERGAEYNMVANSPIGKEWYQQVEAFEAWLVGKTLADMQAIPLEEGRVKPGEDLRSSISIRMGSFFEAIEKAVAAAVEVTGVATVGAESVSSIRPRNATAELPGRIQVNTIFSAVARDADGKVLHVFIDHAQNEGTFGVDGVILATDPVGTKGERGAEVGMAANSPIGKEWFEQIDALEAWMIGKTIDEVKALPLEEDRIKPGEDLRASVSVRMGSYLATFDKIVERARTLD